MGLSLKNIAKGFLGTVAPTIATGLLGPLGGMATTWLADKMGVDQAELPTLIGSQNPETIMALKKLDQEFKLEMERMEIDVFGLEVEDKKSARDLARSNMMPHVILSALFVIGYFLILIGLMAGWITLEEAIKDTVILLLGIITREIPTIMQFWFGSSHGSKQKTEKYLNLPKEDK